MHAHRSLAALVCAAFVACRGAGAVQVAWPDAPMELRDDGDREVATDAMWALPVGPARAKQRRAIADASTRRIADALAGGRDLEAARLFDELTALWQDDPAALAAELAPHAALAVELRARFAKAGMLEPALRVLVVLAEIDPAARAAWLAELDEILAFADDLARAELGAFAVRAQPLELLHATANALPLPWLVDRYVKLLVERQQVVAALLAQQGATLTLVRAHQDILATSRRVAGVLARAHRGTEIHRHLGRMTNGSIGLDRELVVRAEVLGEQPTAAAYAELAAVLREDDKEPDPGGALALELEALARYAGPDAPAAAMRVLALGAAADARALGRTDQPIALYEQVLAAAGPQEPTSVLKLGKLYAERIGRLASGGRPRAATAAWREVIEFTAGAAAKRPHPAWQQATALAEGALGKGLASQGLIAAGRRSLEASLERAPSIDAFEALTTIDVKVDRFADASRWASTGLDLLGDTAAGDRYRRAKLERIGADALRLAGRADDANERYLDSLRTWASLGEPKDLPRVIHAERLLETARAMWWLGDRPRALSFVHSAIDYGAEGPAIAAHATVFLLLTGHYRDALDAFHRGLAAAAVPEVYKVYMSLWVLAHARRTGEPADRQAREFLAARDGNLWYERLAQAATGRLTYAALVAAATTGPQRGELAFYGAVLGLAPSASTPAGYRALLQQTIDARVVFDAEYDLARLYLAR